MLFASKVWGNPFTEFYPEQNSIILNFDLAESKEYLNWAKNSMMDKTFNEVLKCLNEKISVDLSNDLKAISISFIKVKMGFLSIENSVPFIFLSGNFKSKENWMALIKSLAKDTTEQEPKISNISVNGKDITIVSAGTLQYFFLNDSTIFIGTDGTSTLLDKKEITFTKAPESLIKVSKFSKSYMYIEKDYIRRTPLIAFLFGKSEKYSSLSVYIKEKVINFIINIDDSKLVREEAKLLEDEINKFSDKYAEHFEKSKKYLTKIPLNHFLSVSKEMYSDALFKKLVDNLKIAPKENYVLVTLPYDDFLMKHAIINFINIGLYGLYENLNKDIFKACKANREELSKAIDLYNTNGESNWRLKDRLNEEKEDSNPSHRRIKEIITEPNKNGRTTMVLDIPTLYERGCLSIYPLKPDPDCEYVVKQADYNIISHNVVCLKHSFINKVDLSFGSCFVDYNYSYNMGYETFESDKNSVIKANFCYLKQKNIYEAIKKFNDSHDNQMTKLNLSTLIESGMLNKDSIKTINNCEYFSLGDLSTDEGFIYCKTHGIESFKLGMESKIKDFNDFIKINFSKIDSKLVALDDISTITSCARNIDFITMVVNRENRQEDGVKTTSELNLKEIVEKKKIHINPFVTNPECEYYIEGDMTKNGHVACKKHGTLKIHY